MRGTEFEQNTIVPSAGLSKLVWPGMVLAGLALGGLVFISWPEPTTQVVRLPYGESAPKAPSALKAAERAVAAETPAAAASVPSAAKAPSGTSAPVAEEPGRVLAAVAVDPAFAGPDPVPSQLELEPGYEQQRPEALGAEPLPGAELTPEPPPVAR